MLLLHAAVAATVVASGVGLPFSVPALLPARLRSSAACPSRPPLPTCSCTGQGLMCNDAGISVQAGTCLMSYYTDATLTNGTQTDFVRGTLMLGLTGARGRRGLAAAWGTRQAAPGMSKEAVGRGLTISQTSTPKRCNCLQGLACRSLLGTTGPVLTTTCRPSPRPPWTPSPWSRCGGGRGAGTRARRKKWGKRKCGALG